MGCVVKLRTERVRGSFVFFVLVRLVKRDELDRFSCVVCGFLSSIFQSYPLEGEYVVNWDEDREVFSFFVFFFFFFLFFYNFLIHFFCLIFLISPK